MSYPPPAGYGPPSGYGGYAGPVQNQSNGLAVAALVVGIISLLCAWPLGIVAVGLGIAGLSRSKSLNGVGRGQAIAGMITGAIGVVVAIAVLLIFVVFADDVGDRIDDPSFLCGSDETSSQGYPCESQGSDDPNGGDDGVNSDPEDQICNVDRFSQDPDC